jgi:hypothetical protein
MARIVSETVILAPGCPRESRADPLGIRHRLGRDETDRRSYRRRHDHLRDSCADSSSRVFVPMKARALRRDRLKLEAENG